MGWAGPISSLLSSKWPMMTPLAGSGPKEVGDDGGN